MASWNAGDGGLGEPQPRLYFAYGSNLSSVQMSARCPGSKLYKPCVALLRGYKWIISSSGYANVVPVPPTLSNIQTPIYTAEQYKPDQKHEVVFGLLYELSPADEERLDGYEGVPDDYEKLELDVEVVGMPHEEKEIRAVEALVYVNATAETGKCREEYVGRMRTAVADGLEKGMPRQWFHDIIGKWLPLEDITSTRQLDLEIPWVPR